jgi:Uma2 family endonuclease
MNTVLAPSGQISREDYFALETSGDRRYEFLVGEVLSPGAEAHDRGMSFGHYRSIAGLDHYLVLDQDRTHAELYSPVNGAWQLTEASGLEGSIDLPHLGGCLPLAELSRQVGFPAQGGGAA